MKLEYTFFSPALFQQALRHKSAGSGNNERLEFLGDAIVNFIIADVLYHRFTHATEGQLSRLRSQLVKQESLADIARRLNLGEQLILGAGEMKSGGHRRESLLSDALEALIAAIYLDSDFITCKQVVLPWFAEKIEGLTLEEEYKDYKTQLQEWLQSRQRPLPIYKTVEETGADNNRHFIVQCEIKRCDQNFIGQGSSKKQAEQEAAASALAFLQWPSGRT